MYIHVCISTKAAAATAGAGATACTLATSVPLFTAQSESEKLVSPYILHIYNMYIFI